MTDALEEAHQELIDRMNTVAAMQTFGGSFVKLLGLMAQSADHINFAKMQATWPEYFATYAKMGKEKPLTTEVYEAREETAAKDENVEKAMEECRKFNRIKNTENQGQGTFKKVLCVCSAGLLRSPTAANTIHKTWGFNTRAAGLVSDYGLIVVDDVLLAWADEIVCMTEPHRVILRSMTDKPIQCLGIPDDFNFMDTALVGMIRSEYDPKLVEVEHEI